MHVLLLTASDKVPSIEVHYLIGGEPPFIQEARIDQYVATMGVPGRSATRSAIGNLKFGRVFD